MKHSCRQVVTKGDENDRSDEYKEINHLGAHFQVKRLMNHPAASSGVPLGVMLHSPQAAWD